MNIVWIDRKDQVTIFQDVAKYWNEGDGFWRLRKTDSNICINEQDIKVLGKAEDVLDGSYEALLLEQEVEEGTSKL